MFYDLVDNYSSALELIPSMESISLREGGLELKAGDVIERNVEGAKDQRFVIESFSVRYDLSAEEPIISAVLKILFGRGGSIIVDVPELLKIDENTGKEYFRKVEGIGKKAKKEGV